MANEEHLAILKKGVKEWNRWREENPEERPDLREADLRGTNLRDGLRRADLVDVNLSQAALARANLDGALLYNANLRNAILSEAILSEAILCGADLRGANLSGANLSRASLSDVSLISANLSGANLGGVDLYGSNLSYADLTGAGLSGAKLASTTLGFIDLSETKNLKQTKHHGPSTMGTDTLTLSKGKIPEEFLRGCGLTDWEIEAAKLYDPDLTRDEITDITYEMVNLKALSPIVLHHVFISYSHADSTFVETLEAGLDEKRIRYWRDVHDMKAGRMDRQIEKAIRVNPLMLLVLSQRSVESDWVEWEVSKARELEKQEKRDVLCPIALDDAWKTCDWPGPLRQQVMDYNILDFSDTERFDQQFEKLVGGIVENYPADLVKLEDLENA